MLQTISKINLNHMMLMRLNQCKLSQVIQVNQHLYHNSMLVKHIYFLVINILDIDINLLEMANMFVIFFLEIFDLVNGLLWLNTLMFLLVSYSYYSQIQGHFQSKCFLFFQDLKYCSKYFYNLLMNPFFLSRTHRDELDFSNSFHLLLFLSQTSDFVSLSF